MEKVRKQADPPWSEDCTKMEERVYSIDITGTGMCQSPEQIITCIEGPAVIEKILNQLKAWKADQIPATDPAAAAPAARLRTGTVD